MRVRTVSALALCGTMVAACATPPNNIKPTAVATTYSGLSCQQLMDKAIQTNSKLGDLTAVQGRTASNDAYGVLWLGLPVGSMGDKDAKQREGEIAMLKGELAAIQKARVAGKCVKSST
ncbi:MAG: hypothetical protein E5V75_34125 [Mesorhizobium sp.]|nr:MAG: hypothetical protein E5V75_34125 [Mesorhizobium sp.]